MALDDRSKDVSRELTEIRTVLSRAETALRTIQRTDQGTTTTEWYTDENDGVSRWRSVHKDPDPDTVQMQAALIEVVVQLDRWRGKRKSRASQWS